MSSDRTNALLRTGRTSMEDMFEWAFYALAGVGVVTALVYAFL